MQLAALFYDIGHGPFGDLFEMFCRRNPAYLEWTHEHFGLKLMKGAGTSDSIYQQIPNFLRELAAELVERVEAGRELFGLLSADNLHRISKGDPPDLADPIPNAKYHFLKDIITSSYGVDRLDYLRRGAYFSGGNTGSVDLWEIISNLGIRKFDDTYCLFLERSVAPGLCCAKGIIIRGLPELTRPKGRATTRVQRSSLVLVLSGETT